MPDAPPRTRRYARQGCSERLRGESRWSRRSRAARATAAAVCLVASPFDDRCHSASCSTSQEDVLRLAPSPGRSGCSSAARWRRIICRRPIPRKYRRSRNLVQAQPFAGHDVHDQHAIRRLGRTRTALVSIRPCGRPLRRQMVRGTRIERRDSRLRALRLFPAHGAANSHMPPTSHGGRVWDPVCLAATSRSAGAVSLSPA